MHGIGREEGVFRAVNRVLNVCLGGIAYLYVGWNTWNGTIDAGGGVRYAGAVTLLFEGVTQVIRAGYDLRGTEKFLQQYYEILDVPADIGGNRKLPVEHLITLCKFYNVSADYILGLPRGLNYPER